MSNSKENQSKDIIVKEGSAMFELIELIREREASLSIKTVRKQAIYGINTDEFDFELQSSCCMIEQLEEVINKVEIELKAEKEVVCQN